MHRALRPGLALILLGLAAGPGLADDAPLTPAALATGFAKLEQLGAPNVATATYVNLESSAARALLTYPYDSRGNAWLQRETRDTNGRPVKGTLVTTSAATVELTYAENPWQGGTDNAPNACGRWRPVNLARETRGVLAFLNDMSNDPSAGVYLGSDTRAALFLFAMHLHQRGDTNSADRIVRGLFQHVQDRRIVILEALNRLADTQYEQVYQDFRVTRDWPAYRRGITNLTARYPQGWKARPALERLVTRIDERLAGATPTPDTTNGLTAADRELADRLTGLQSLQKKPEYDRPGVAWLLPATWTNRYPVTGDVDLEIRARGVAGLPLLMALAGDGALTETDAEPLRPRAYSRRVPDPAEEDKALALFNCIPRPATRGEAALAILAAILPESGNENSGSQAKPDVLLATARDLHAGFAGRPAGDLAVRLLRENNPVLDAELLALLAPLAARQPIPALEAYVVGDFNEDYARNSFDREPARVAERRAAILTQYAALRATGTAPLVTQLVARIEREAANYRKPANISYGSEERNQEHVTEMARKLRATATRLAATRFDDTTDTLVDDALKGRDIDELLTARLRALPPPEAAGLLLGKAAAAGTPDARLRAAGLIATLRRQLGAEAPTLAAAAREAAWRDLVSDDRHGTNSTVPVADRFLCLNEALFAATNTLPPAAPGRYRVYDTYYDYALQERSPGQLARETISTFGAEGRALVRARVLARQAGTPETGLPKYPHQAAPDAAEAAGLRSRFAAVTTREAAARLVSEQPLGTRVALPALLAADPALNRHLTTLAVTLTNITATGDATLPGVLTPWLNRPVEPALIRLLSDYCLRQSSNQVPVLCTLERRADFGGCTLTVRPAPAELMAVGLPRREVESTGDDGDARATAVEQKVDPAAHRVVGVTGLVCARGVLGSARWRTAPPPATEDGAAFVTSDPEVREHLDQAIDGFCGSRTDAMSPGFVRFVSKGPAP